MPTVANIITIAKISQYLASNDIANGSLFGPRVNQLLANEIYLVSKSVQYRYDYEDIAGGSTPSASLLLTSNYLLSLCDKYGLGALSLVGGGGSIPGSGTITTVWGYPIQDDYTATTEGETQLLLSLPTGSHVSQVIKGNTPLDTQDWEYDAPYINLLNGVQMVTDEKIFYLYVVPL